MAQIFNYFDSWRTAELTCAKCGWKGGLDPEQLNPYRDLFDFTCPKCSTIVAIINYPSEAEVKENWDKLPEDEKRHYGVRFELDRQFEQQHLSDASQLPDISNDPLILVWDFETSPGGELSGPTYTLIKHNGRTIWREPAYYECVGRYGQVVEVLQQKYGSRLKDLIPTAASSTYLGGDDLNAWSKLRDFRQQMAPDSLNPEQRLDALAKAGDVWALRYLRYKKEIADHKLESRAQLPQLDGDLVVLSWHLAEDPPGVTVNVSHTLVSHTLVSHTLKCEWPKERGDGFLYLYLLHSGHAIWKEAAPRHNPGETGGAKNYELLAKRYAEVVRILKRKYGPRLKDVVPTYASNAYVWHWEPLNDERARQFTDRGDPSIEEAIARASEYGAIMMRVVPDEPGLAPRKKRTTRPRAPKKQTGKTRN